LTDPLRKVPLRLTTGGGLRVGRKALDPHKGPALFPNHSGCGDLDHGHTSIQELVRPAPPAATTGHTWGHTPLTVPGGLALCRLTRVWHWSGGLLTIPKAMPHAIMARNAMTGRTTQDCCHSDEQGHDAKQCSARVRSARTQRPVTESPRPSPPLLH
jgi:hypothetical protein